MMKDAPVGTGTPVIVRADFDVAVMKGRVADDSRIMAVVPTLRELLRRGARIRIVAHMGRPHGAYDPALSMAPVVRMLARILRRRVILIRDPLAAPALEKYGDSPDILLFENIRFWPDEEKNGNTFAKSLARWGEVYINEAFANCHRRHASVSALPALIPAYAGIHLAGEIAALGRLLKNPKRPFVAVLGGAKLETKIPLIRRFVYIADEVLIGGALANTLFALRGFSIGKSIAEPHSKVPRVLLRSKKIVLPADILAADRLGVGARWRVSAFDSVRGDEYITDIGPKARADFASRIARAHTIVWNGPMGLTEIPAFAKGTVAVAGAIRKNKEFTVVGGGDTLAALGRYRTGHGFSHVSMGGGAMLAFLAGEKMPGLEALRL